MTPHGPPRSLRLVTGTYPVMRGVRYTVSRGIVTRVQQGTSVRACRRKPAPEEWDRFWKTVERLGVRQWRGNYEKPREAGTYTLDGKGWRFSMRSGSFVVHSGGRGGFPSMGNPRESTCSTTALVTLQTALDRLIDGPPMPTETLEIDGIPETGEV